MKWAKEKVRSLGILSYVFCSQNSNDSGIENQEQDVADDVYRELELEISQECLQSSGSNKPQFLQEVLPCSWSSKFFWQSLYYQQQQPPKPVAVLHRFSQQW